MQATSGSPVVQSQALQLSVCTTGLCVARRTHVTGGRLENPTFYLQSTPKETAVCRRTTCSPPDLGSWPLPPGSQLRPAGPIYFTCIGDQTWPVGPTYFTCIGDQTRPAGPTYFTCIGDQIWPAGLTYFTCIGDQTFQKCSYPDTMAVYHTEFTLSEAYITLIRKQKLFTPHPPPQKKRGGGGSEHPQDLYYSSEHSTRCSYFYGVPAIQRATDGYTWTLMSSQTC